MVQALVATILLAIPIRLFGLQLPEPIFAMPVVFAWAVIRPSILAPMGILIMGLFMDLFWGGAMGLWALSLLISYGVVLSARTMLVGQSQPMMAFWYAAATALAMGAAYLIAAMTTHAIPSWRAMGLQFLPTVLLYPFAHRLIDRFEDADVRFR